MVESAATFAGFAYFTEMLVPSKSRTELEFKDYDLTEEAY